MILRLEPCFSLNMTERIELFLIRLGKLNHFFKWRKELNLLFLECDGKNWTLFQIWLQEMNFFFFEIRLTELNLFKYDSKILFFKYDSKIFLHMTQRIELFFVWLQELNFFSTMTQIIEPFEYDSKNWNFFWMWFKDFFTKMTLSIEPFF